MWKFLTTFRSNKNSNDDTPPRDHTNHIPPRHQISPSQDRDSFDSNDTSYSKLTIPPSTKNKCLSAPGMELIYSTAQTNEKPKSREKRSSQCLTLAASRTDKKDFEWHDKEGFPTKKQDPVMAANDSASGSAAPAKRRRIYKKILPKYGCEGHNYNFSNATHCDECGLQWDTRDKTTMCPNCECCFHKSCMRPLNKRCKDLLYCKYCRAQLTK